MFNPTQIAAWKRHLVQKPDEKLFELKPVSFRSFDLPKSTQIRALDEEIGTLYNPTHVFGEPFDVSCLDGIGRHPIKRVRPRLIKVNNAQIVGWQTVITDNGVFLPASLNETTIETIRSLSLSNDNGCIIENHGDEHLTIRYAQRLIKRSIAGTGFYFHNLEPGNYGSFLIRQTAQILATKSSGIEPDFYVLPQRTSWTQDFITSVGLPRKPVFALKEISGDNIETLLFWDMMDTEGFFTDTDFLELRSIFPSQHISSRPTRLYVSRILSGLDRPHYRNLTNEAEIEDIMIRKGFSAVYPETMSFAEQASLFAGADLIAGASGSGMLNAVFSKSGAKVLDIETYHVTVRQHAKVYSSSYKDYAFLFSRDLVDPSQPLTSAWSLARRDLDEALEWLCA